MNEEKHNNFLSIAENRVQNVIHGMEIIAPMGRSNNYDYTKEDVELMINAIENSLQELKVALNRRFEEQVIKEKKTFSFASASTSKVETTEEPVETVETEDNTYI